MKARPGSPWPMVRLVHAGRPVARCRSRMPRVQRSSLQTDEGPARIALAFRSMARAFRRAVRFIPRASAPVDTVTARCFGFQAPRPFGCITENFTSSVLLDCRFLWVLSRYFQPTEIQTSIFSTT